MNKCIITLLLFYFSSALCYSQSDEVKDCLQHYSNGNTDEAKNRFPELLAKYPNDPGVKFLHGVLLEDGSLAVNIYKDIISKFPKSEWVDDSYLRLIQYYSITGDTNDAKKYLNEFKKNNPNSEYIVFAENAVKVSINQNRKNSTPEVLTEMKSDIDTNVDENIQSPNNQPKQITPEKITKSEKNFALQVGIYSTQTSAKNEVARYAKVRLVANIYPKLIGNETMYAVIIGAYKSRQMAENAKPIVAKQCNCIPLIIEK